MERRARVANYKLCAGGRSDVSVNAKKHVAVEKYVVVVSVLRNTVQVIWEKSEDRRLLSRYKKCAPSVTKTVGSRIYRKKRTTKRPMHGVPETTLMANFWAMWNSRVFCARRSESRHLLRLQFYDGALEHCNL